MFNSGFQGVNSAAALDTITMETDDNDGKSEQHPGSGVIAVATKKKLLSRYISGADADSEASRKPQEKYAQTDVGLCTASQGQGGSAGTPQKIPDEEGIYLGVDRQASPRCGYRDAGDPPINSSSRGSEQSVEEVSHCHGDPGVHHSVGDDSSHKVIHVVPDSTCEGVESVRPHGSRDDVTLGNAASNHDSAVSSTFTENTAAEQNSSPVDLNSIQVDSVSNTVIRSMFQAVRNEVTPPRADVSGSEAFWPCLESTDRPGVEPEGLPNTFRRGSTNKVHRKLMWCGTSTVEVENPDSNSTEAASDQTDPEVADPGDARFDESLEAESLVDTSLKKHGRQNAINKLRNMDETDAPCTCEAGERQLDDAAKKVRVDKIGMKVGEHHHCGVGECLFITHYFASYVRHRAMCHSIVRPGLKLYTCKICPKITIQLSEYARHLEKHAHNGDEFARMELIKCAEMGIKVKRTCFLPGTTIINRRKETKKLKKPAKLKPITQAMKISAKRLKSAKKVVVEKKFGKKLKKLTRGLPRKIERYEMTVDGLVKVEVSDADQLCRDLSQDSSGRYLCGECPFTTGMKQSMLRHRVALHNLRPLSTMYYCRLCSMGTTQRYDFFRHCMARKHHEMLKAAQGENPGNNPMPLSPLKASTPSEIRAQIQKFMGSPMFQSMPEDPGPSTPKKKPSISPKKTPNQKSSSQSSSPKKNLKTTPNTPRIKLKIDGSLKLTSISPSGESSILVPSKVTPKKLFYCKWCNFANNSKDIFKVHLKSETHIENLKLSDDESTFYCEICRRTFKNSSLLVKHQQGSEHQEKIKQTNMLKNENTEGTDSGKQGRRAAWFCVVCQVQMISEWHYQKHIAGKSHRLQRKANSKTAGSLDEASPLQVTEEESSAPPDHSILSSGEASNGKKSAKNSAWFCDVCRIQTVSEWHYQQHLIGKKHRLAQRVCSPSGNTCTAENEPTNNLQNTSPEDTTCQVCKLTFSTIWYYEKHKSTKKHRKNQNLLEQGEVLSPDQSSSPKSNNQFDNLPVKKPDTELENPPLKKARAVAKKQTRARSVTPQPGDLIVKKPHLKIMKKKGSIHDRLQSFFAGAQSAADQAHEETKPRDEPPVEEPIRLSPVKSKNQISEAQTEDVSVTREFSSVVPTDKKRKSIMEEDGISSEICTVSTKSHQDGNPHSGNPHGGNPHGGNPQGGNSRDEDGPTRRKRKRQNSSDEDDLQPEGLIQMLKMSQLGLQPKAKTRESPGQMSATKVDHHKQSGSSGHGESQDEFRFTSVAEEQIQPESLMMLPAIRTLTEKQPPGVPTNTDISTDSGPSSSHAPLFVGNTPQTHIRFKPADPIFIDLCDDDDDDTFIDIMGDHSPVTNQPVKTEAVAKPGKEPVQNVTVEQATEPSNESSVTPVREPPRETLSAKEVTGAASVSSAVTAPAPGSVSLVAPATALKVETAPIAEDTDSDDCYIEDVFSIATTAQAPTIPPAPTVNSAIQEPTVPSAPTTAVHSNTEVKPQPVPMETQSGADPGPVTPREDLMPLSLDQVQSDSLVYELRERKRLFSCVCGMSFIDQRMFWDHQVCHVPGRPMTCACCRRVFTDWKSFHHHMFMHQ